ncbi:MAG: hypothetical protein V1889_02835 [archaeon]
MRNKRGWIRILEATIAVMIVAGVLVVAYAKQVDRGEGPVDYFHSLEKQILMDISSSSELRLMALNGDEASLDLFVDGEIPDAFGHYLRVCVLGSVDDFCKINDTAVVAEIKDKSVFVEEIIVSADLGDGSNAEYDPKKVRLFVWER